MTTLLFHHVDDSRCLRMFMGDTWILNLPPPMVNAMANVAAAHVSTALPVCGFFNGQPFKCFETVKDALMFRDSDACGIMFSILWCYCDKDLQN